MTDPESGDVCHRSTPQTVTFREGSITLFLQAVIEAAHPAETVEVEVITRIRPATVWPDGQVEVYLSSHDLDRLIARATTERERIRLQSAPVFRPAATVVAA